MRDLVRFITLAVALAHASACGPVGTSGAASPRASNARERASVRFLDDVGRRMPWVLACHGRYTPSATVVLEVRVQADGRLDPVSIREAREGDAELPPCLARRLAELRATPPPTGSGHLYVVFGFRRSRGDVEVSVAVRPLDVD